MILCHFSVFICLLHDNNQQNKQNCRNHRLMRCSQQVRIAKVASTAPCTQIHAKYRSWRASVNIERDNLALLERSPRRSTSLVFWRVD